MGKTTIPWCEFTVNPIRCRDISAGKVGHYCEKISPGCANCYASKRQPRFGLPEFSAKHRRHLQSFLDRKTLIEVIKRKTKTAYFWANMSDLFGSWVETKWLDECFATMALTPWHTHLILTKRPDRARGYINERPLSHIKDAAFKLAADTHAEVPPESNWPLRNVRVGVSIENQPTADQRVPELFRIHVAGAGYFLSIEPQLGPITIKFAACTCPNRPQSFKSGHLPECAAPKLAALLDRVIVGGESGPGARWNHLQWTRSIVRQCSDLGLSCFVKQLGAKPTLVPAKYDGTPESRPIRLKLIDRKGENPKEWPTDLQVREPSKSRAW